jgi:hypothetical protein
MEIHAVARVRPGGEERDEEKLLKRKLDNMLADLNTQVGT